MWQNDRARRNGGLASDLAKGAIAGVFATWAMGLVTTYLYEAESEDSRNREDAARAGKTAYGVAAEKAAGLVGRELADDERQHAGSAVHWALGACAGAAYAGMRNRVPTVDRAHGLLFGAVFWAVIDETANVALGLTPGPAAFPWQTHGRGLAGHLVFGLAADTALRALDRIG